MEVERARRFEAAAGGWCPCAKCTDPMDCASWATCVHPDAIKLDKLDAGAKAIYTVTVNGRPGWESLSAETKHKFRRMAMQCFEAMR